MDAYQIVTDKIVEQMDKGIVPWKRPFTSVKTCGWSRSTGKEYSFLNQMLLACQSGVEFETIDEMLAQSRGEWLTYKQAEDEGGHVKKGEKSRKVLFFKWLEKETGAVDESTGEAVTDSFPCLRLYPVFRVDQCEGLIQKHHIAEEHDISTDLDAEDVISDYISRSGVKFTQRPSNQAYYMPTQDEIVIPNREQFTSSAEYYSTVFHEMAHSTGHESRLNRAQTSAKKDKGTYSVEELVAEITSASVCCTLHISSDSAIANSASYISNWMEAIKDNKKMFVVAASQAEKAIRLILNIQQEKT